MNKVYFLITFLFAFVANGIAQDDCCNAFPLGGSGPFFAPSSAGNGVFETVGDCSCLASHEHDSFWMAFECTGSGTFEMMITPDMLSADFDFAIYADGCPCDNHTLVAACDYTGPITPPGPFVPTGISSTPMATFGVPGATEFIGTINLVAGTTYYIIADNITSNGAGFEIQFAGTAQMGPPSTVGPPPPPDPILGELSPCPGTPFNYSVPNNPDYSFEWTVDPGGPIIDGNGESSVDITWDQPGFFNLCVEASDGCNISPPNCVPVFVANIMGPLVEDIICLDDTYEAPDGQTFSSPGLYEMTFTNFQGCDSIVPLLLDLALTQLTIMVEEICDGDCVEFAGETFCQTGVYEEILETWQGCDSTVTLNLIVIPNDAVILGGGSISCDGIPVILDGSTSIGGSNMMYTWTNQDGDVVGTDPFYEATIPGDYTLTINSEVGVNTCTDMETITVDAANDPPENISALGGTITCTSTSVNLMGNSSTAGVTYEWSGPGGFSSADQNPTASAIGVYTLVVTGPNGCTGIETAEIDGDSNIPTAEADGGIIDCTVTSVNLAGSSNTAGVTYEWTGPNSFTSTDQNPTVGDPGSYTLTVTAPNGCSAQAAALVGEDIGVPDAEAAGGDIDCINTATVITGNSMTPDVTYEWAGPNSFSSTEQNPSVNEQGTYILTVTALNGCTATATADVNQNADLPDAAATGGLINCTNPMIDLIGSSMTAGVTYAWEGPGGFTSDDQNPTVNAAGTYILTVTATNGCTATAEAIVTDDFDEPDAMAVGGTVTCATGSVTLMGSSTTANITYSWIGPGGNVINEQNPLVSATGTYTLVVTAANGCTGTAEADVIQDAGVPDAMADGGTLDCLVAQVTISGSSNTPGVTYEWTGPNGFTSSALSEIVTEAGDYVLVVTAPNNCTAEAVAVVVLDDGLPDFMVEGGTLSCDETDIMLTSQVNTPGSTFEWTGPNGFISSDPNPVVSASGTYTFSITGPNGCSTSGDAEVLEDADLPDVSVTGGIIDCNEPEFTLDGNSNTPGVTFEWTGPNGFITDVLDSTIVDAGDYVLTVTAVNGCSASATAVIVAELDEPEAVTATGGILSCAAGSLDLAASSTTANVSYNWTGPNGFASDEQNPSITDPGSYILIVTGLNGCTTTDQAIVGQDANAPQVEAEGALLSCNELMVQVTSSSTTQGVTYSWTGPNGFTSDDQNPMVDEGGTYVVEVMAPNGCVSDTTIIVDQDFDEPENVTAIGGTLTCTSGILNISGNSTSANVTYEWTGPNGFTSAGDNVDVTESGTYTLIVTGSNGCTSTAEAMVENDSNVPTALADGGEVTCLVPLINLNGQSNTGIDFLWTGPNGFTSTEPNPAVDEAGTYTLLVTAANGCDNTIDVEVTVNNDEPQATASGGLITCQQPDLALQGDSPSTNVTYSWSGPGGFSSSDQNPVVNVGGDYVLTVTGDNGCTSIATAMVELDADVPTAQADGGIIDCNNDLVVLDGSADQTVVSWEWIGPNGFTSTEQNPTVTGAGSYTLTITTGNGCSASANALVEENTLLPVVVIANPNPLTCDNETSILDATGSDNGPGFTFEWTTINGNFLNGQSTLSPEVNEAGTYTLEIINTNNGCVNSASVDVIVSGDTPSGATIVVDDGFCFGENSGVAFVEAVEGGTPPYLYALGNGAFGTENVFTGLAPGVYQIRIQDSFGCEFSDSFTVDTPTQIVVDLSPVGVGATGVPLGTAVNLLVDLNIPSSEVANVTWSPAGIDDGCPEPCLSISFVPDQSQNYLVEVTDVNGCTGETSLLVTVDKSRPVFVPNAFSPNNDGLNDALLIFGGDSVEKVKSFLVFSRWGESVYQGFNFPHSDFDFSWDGTYRGKIMDPGVYTWFAEVEFVDGEVIMYQGDVTLIR